MRLAAAAIAAGLALAACEPAPSANPDGSGNDLSAPTVTAPTGEDAERAAVTKAYDRFWTRTLQIPHEPQSTWADALAQVAVNPQLKTTLQGMRLAREQGITSYGRVSSRISQVEIDGKTATVVDCQDASRSGQKNVRTGEKKTVGVERNPVRARMKHDGGAWKVTKITYPGGEC